MENNKAGWTEYKDIKDTLVSLLDKGYNKDMIQTVLEQIEENEDFNHEGFYNFLLNTIQPNEMEKYRNMFLSSGEIAN